MEISYLGLSSFKLRGTKSTVVTDPYGKETGLRFPKVAADIVTVSHQHPGHNYVAGVTGTKDRPTPLVIQAPGEYEASGISVYGYPSFHDTKEGADRGKNVMYVVYVDGVRIAHMGDLGHKLSERQIEQLNSIDVLLIPVGGFSTIGPKEAAAVIEDLQPGIVIPMHYRIEGLGSDFEKLATVDNALKEMNVTEPKREDKLVVVKGEIPEQTEYVVLTPKTS